MEFKTERLHIRPIHINDKQAVFQYRSDAVTNQFQGWIPKTIVDVEEFIGKVSPVFNLPDTWFQFVVTDKDSPEIIGDIGIHFMDNTGAQVEIGCTLSKQFHGKGFATEALKNTIDLLFKKLNKHRIVTSIDPKNKKSIELVERLGFRKEAHFTESLFINGKWVDDVVYAILNKEWN